MANYERDWQFSFDNFYMSTGSQDQTKHQLWNLKAMLTGQTGSLTGSGLWTLVSSSDSVSVSGGDLWGSTYDQSKIIRGNAANARSWAILKSPSMNGKTFYLTISYDGAADANASLYMAKAVPSASVTGTPSGSDQWLVGAVSSSWNAGTSDTLPNRFNMCLSTTGDFYWFAVQSGHGIFGGLSQLGVLAVAPANCSPFDPYPIFTQKFQNTGVPGGFSAAQLISSPQAARTFNGQLGTAFVLAGTGQAPNAFADAITGGMVDNPCWIAAQASSAMWHMRGRLPDTFLIPNSSTGGTFQAGAVVRDRNGNMTHLIVGNLLIPATSLPNLF